MPDPAMNAIQQLLNTPEPAALGPGRRSGALSETALGAKLEELIRPTNLPTAKQQLIRALLLLWHDHLDASHAISQGIENADGSYVHAIMHRREPDFWNSEYWFRRVGKHPCFPELAKRATALMESRSESALLNKLVQAGQWDAFAFVDACKEASAGGGEKQVLLREIQKIEFEVLLEHFLKGA